MLRELYIHNYTIIKELSLPFSPGLTVITGETGTGKSIIIDALGFSLGERHRRGVKKDTCIESSFTNCEALLSKLGIKENTMIFRADVKERVRYYLNDSPTPSKVISEIRKKLIDMVGSHSHQSFFSPDVQLELLDDFAGIKNEVSSFGKLYRLLCECSDKLERLKKEIEETKRTEEFIRWELESIERLNPKSGEDVELEERLFILENAEKLLQIVGECRTMLAEDGGVEDHLARVNNLITELVQIDTQVDTLSKRIKNIYYEVKDIGSLLSSYMEKIDLDPEEIEKIRARVMELKDLKRRFKGDLEKVIEKRDELKSRLKGLLVNDEEKNKIEREIEELKKEVDIKAKALSKARMSAAKNFKGLVMSEFRDLGLGKAKFDIKIEQTGMKETGKDSVEFMFSANPDQEMASLANIASRGELSRCMLALKKVLAEVDRIPTLIFDEIDIGVSGRIADAVGDKLKELSERHQVVCITHLPQIAAKAEIHIRVNKVLEGGKTNVTIEKLTGKDREEEIAKLIAGREVTESARKHARALLKQE
ncbi:MAG: DNA repair protein RecN [candidate division WOR-3 bacterium]|nr:DNA repair protein RecN [candidate division WOR-3 bacterium]